MKHILFLTTSNLATNPRLYKELELALQSGYKTTVFMFKLNNWSDAKTEGLRYELELCYPNAISDLELITLHAIPKNKLDWLYWGLSEKIAKKAYSLMPGNLKWNALGNSRRALQLLNAAASLQNRPDLISGHNLGSLYPAYELSMRWKIPFMFDVEDYHPGETVDFDTGNEKLRREFLMKTLLPKAQAVTLASPLIGTYTEKLVGGFNYAETILNGFNSNEFNLYQNDQVDIEVLKLVWFSQKVSYGRGLEQLFEALSLISESDFNVALELTLIGEMDSGFQDKVIHPLQSKLQDTAICLEIKAPLQQKDLHAEICRYDVGLALEFDSRDLNRQICLTNKIITYAQAGVYILATDTKAQEQFISEHPELGVLSQQSSKSLANTLLTLWQNKNQIQVQKSMRFNLGQELSWNQEQEKLKRIWNQIL